MNRDQFVKKQLAVSVEAGINQRFHQKVAGAWAVLNRVVQVSVACLAVASLCIVFGREEVASLNTEKWVAGLAAFAAIVLNVIPLGDWVQAHLELFRRWCDLREEVDCLIFELGDKAPQNPLVEKLKHVNAKIHRVASAEPGLGWYDERLFRQCERAEKISRPMMEPDTIPEVAPFAREAISAVTGIFWRSKAG